MMKRDRLKVAAGGFSALIISTLLFTPGTLAAATDPEAAIYLGTYTGNSDIDAQIDLDITDLDVDGDLDTTIIFTEWTKVPGTESLYRGAGSITIKGEMSVEDTIDEDIDFNKTFTQEDNITLDASTGTVMSDDIIIEDDINFQLDGIFDDNTDSFSSDGEFHADFDPGQADGVLKIDLMRTTDPDVSFGVNEQTYFDYNYNREGWDFGRPPEFSGIIGEYDGGRRSIAFRVSANDNVFGYWEAPGMRLPETATDKTLLRGYFTVSHSLDNDDDVPAFRIRASSNNFEQTSELQINSTRNALITPKAGATRQYVHYFDMPEGTDEIRIFFDVLNFGGQDSNNVSVHLEEAIIQDVGTVILDVPRQENTYTFTGSERVGFETSFAGNGYAPPVFAATADGLQIQADQSTDSDQIGYWYSTDKTETVRLAAARLYQARFFFSSNATAEQAAQVPTFRARLNDSSFQMASLVHVFSPDADARVPAGGNLVPYDVFFYCPAELTNNRLRMAFDFIYLNAEENNPDIALTLESINIVSFIRPED